SQAAQCCSNSRDLFRLARYRPVPRKIAGEMAPRLGARFRGLWRSLLSTGWRCEFRISYGLRLTIAKDMERRNRTVFSVLANELWLMGLACPGIGSALWLARLDSWLALGYETAGGHRICAVCGCDLRHWVL